MPAWITAAEWAARLIVLLLLGLSVWSVSIMIDRRKYFARTGSFPKEESLRLMTTRDWAGLKRWLENRSELPARMMREALAVQGGSIEQVELAVRSFLAAERAEMERGLTVLATLGSNAPFIGLFGTVLGIISAFAALGSSSSGATSVMSGISEALIATAIGLLVAIPAVVAYNVFSRRIRVALNECESIKDYYLSRMGG